MSDENSRRDLFGHDGGCRYLGTLSMLERLSGYDFTASLDERVANLCRQHGCLVTPFGNQCRGETESYVAGAAEISRLGSKTRTRALPPACDGLTVPFSRSSVVDILADSDGNRVEQRGLDMRTLKAAESLGYLYDYWRFLRGATGCRVTDVDTLQVVRSGAIGRLHVVDVTSNDPDEFRYEIFAYALPTSRIERPKSFPIKIYADNALRNYNTVRLTAVPRLQRIHARFSTVRYHYTRLILPFLDERRNVSHLIVAIRREAGDGMTLDQRDRA